MPERRLPMQIPRSAAHPEKTVTCTAIRPCGPTSNGIAKMERSKDAKEWKNASCSICTLCNSAARDDGARPPTEDNFSNEQNMPQLLMVHLVKLVRRKLRSRLGGCVCPQMGGWIRHTQPRVDEQSYVGQVALVTEIRHIATMGRI